MGRRARPTELYVLDGKHKKGKGQIETRRQAEAAIRPPADKIKPPKWLDKPAKKIWRQIVKDLEGLNILTNVDVHALAVYCDAAARHAEATELVEEHGVVIFPVISAEENDQGELEIVRGTPIQNPAVLVVQKYAGIMARFGSALGLTPTNRASIAHAQAKEQKKKDKFGELFG